MILISIAIISSGCSTYAASRYSISADNVVALRELKGKKVSVGPFAALKLGESEIMCRGVGPIKTPDGEPFSEFIRKALIDELRIADVYSATSRPTLTGTLNEIDFSSATGEWDLALVIKSSNGQSMLVTENYSFSSSYYGETACNQTAQALMPAVQNLVGRSYVPISL